MSEQKKPPPEPIHPAILEIAKVLARIAAKQQHRAEMAKRLAKAAEEQQCA
jgi:hypothetical protein